MDLERVASPTRILLVKGHSSGIGDILRSSAAWRALINRFPKAELHLLFLTREPGYISHPWIARHHLLKRFCVLDKRPKGWRGQRQMLAEATRFAQEAPPELVID